MSKRMSTIGMICIAVLIFFVWKNPGGTADTLGKFLQAVGDLVAEAWDKLGEFVKNLAKG